MAEAMRQTAQDGVSPPAVRAAALEALLWAQVGPISAAHLHIGMLNLLSAASHCQTLHMLSVFPWLERAAAAAV